MMRAAFLAVVCCCTLVLIDAACLAQAVVAELVVTPSRAALPLGDVQYLAANGPDGRPLDGATWKVEGPARITSSGREAVVEPIGPGDVTVVAELNGKSAQAHLKVVAALPQGATRWSVDPVLEGGRTTKITPAVPAANGPDIYVNEASASGSLIRAIAADGRELWRNGSGVHPPNWAGQQVSRIDVAPGLLKTCQDIISGMSLAEVKSAFSGRIPHEMSKDQRVWLFQSGDVTCRVEFSKGGTVANRQIAFGEQ